MLLIKTQQLHFFISLCTMHILGILRTSESSTCWKVVSLRSSYHCHVQAKGLLRFVLAFKHVIPKPQVCLNVWKLQCCTLKQRKNWLLVPSLCCSGPNWRWFYDVLSYVFCVAILISCIFTLNKVATCLCFFLFFLLRAHFDSLVMKFRTWTNFVFSRRPCVQVATVPDFNLCLYDVVWSTAVFLVVC